MRALHISIPPSPRYAATARRAFANFIRFHRMSRADAENLLCAVGEAIANSIQHAKTDEPIELRASIEGEVLTVQVSDRGSGLVVRRGGEATRLPDPLSESGRGFAIMQRCTDYFDVRSDPERGTVVTLARFHRDA